MCGVCQTFQKAGLGLGCWFVGVVSCRFIFTCSVCSCSLEIYFWIGNWIVCSLREEKKKGASRPKSLQYLKGLGHPYLSAVCFLFFHGLLHFSPVLIFNTGVCVYVCVQVPYSCGPESCYSLHYNGQKSWTFFYSEDYIFSWIPPTYLCPTNLPYVRASNKSASGPQ